MSFINDDQAVPLKPNLRSAAIVHAGCVRYPECGGGPWNNVLIANNVIRDWAGEFAIYVVGGGASSERVHRYLIANNIIDNAKGGIGVRGAVDPVLDGNVIRGAFRDAPYFAGVHVQECSGAFSIRGGEIVGSSNSQYGLLGETDVDTADFIIHNVTFDNNEENHIRLNGASTAQIANNRFKGGIPPIFLNALDRAWVSCNVADASNPAWGVANVTEFGNSWNI